MQIQFIVTVNIGKQTPQNTQEFIKEDAKAFIPYLKEKVRDSLTGSWQYNAEAKKVSISRAIHKTKSNRYTPR